MEIEFNDDAGDATGRKLYLQLKSGDSYLRERKRDDAGIFTIRDPLTGEIVRLFHPRTDTWKEHFRYAGAILTGSTANGRATVQVLAINAADLRLVREALMAELVLGID